MSEGWSELSIDDYAEQSAETRQAWQSMSGQRVDVAGLTAPRLLNKTGVLRGVQIECN
jgi:hypothetical protein